MSDQEKKETIPESDKIAKLLAAAESADKKILLTILNKVAAGEVPTQSEHKLLKSLQTELEQKQKSSGTEKTDQVFKNPLAVVSYLRDNGWKIGKSALYKHVTEGRLRPNKDGSFSSRAVDKYAAMYLKRADGTTPPIRKADETSGYEDLQRQKLEAEVKKTHAQAAHWEKRNRDLDAEVDTLVDQRLAQQSIILKTDLRNFANSHAPDIIEIVEGNHGKISDLIAWLNERFENHLARYANTDGEIVGGAVPGPTGIMAGPTNP